MARPFRFAVNMLTPTDGPEWRRKCRRAEELGYDVIQVPDHLGMMAPFPALMAAAEVTERPRLGTFVLNAAFWNPALLAREIATSDALTGGRLEIGIGAGYVKEEHDRAGLEFRTPGGRVAHLRHTVEEVDRLLRDDGHLPKTAHKPRPPLLIGGNGDKVLQLAAEHADIVAFTGARDSGDGLQVLTAEEVDERIAAYRGVAGGRSDEQELNLLLQLVAVTDDREAAVKELLPRVPHLSVEQVLDLPLLAVGTVQAIAGQLREQRERYGFSYFTVLDPYLETFAPVMDELRKG
ncbi:LLM class F420-dependent oxidoreductase [Streptomyces sp. NBC_01167]|uniref:LLM class F420-dependent oxidoreductase n=1 Tax=Streptomyces sp. NBC_01167 TaxID=2903756 RepID=UPI00386CC45F|nr:LLM class F420-dependent oxidoreductase [Streptomyces sp. NBC_01167]